MERLWSGSAYLEDLPLSPGPVSAGGSSAGGSRGGAWGRPCCQWGHHPRTVLVSTGKQLLSVDVRAGAGGGGGGAVVALWGCGAGEGLLALAASQQVRLLGLLAQAAALGSCKQGLRGRVTKRRGEEPQSGVRCYL